MRRNKISLDTLQNTIKKDDHIDLTEDESIQATDLVVIKRDGREEPYNIKKMIKVVLWACDGKKALVKDLLQSTEIKLYPRIKITDVYEELIKTAASKISLLYPQWEYIAAKLYLLSLYKESWHISNGEYPDLKDVIDKGIQHGIYNKEVFQSYTDEEITEISDNINAENDLIFTFKGLHTFNDKYCLNYSKTKKLELPQHVYVRVAMFNHHQMKGNRVAKVLETYNYLSNHDYTNGTPITINSGTQNAQLSSCVLNAVEDDTDSILDTVKNLGVYSKFKGGTALDITRLRGRGSYITGNQGNSSGPVPFIKIVESTMKAFNQGGKRAGACCVYFQWWHINFSDLVVLKSNGGTEENRARGLKYAVKLNQLLIDRWHNDEDVSLFDPKDVRELFGLTGREFDVKYVEYENKPSIRRKTISARDLLYSVMKERTETGNVYLFHEENVNNHNIVGSYINMSNLCTEILEKSIPSTKLSEELVVRESGDRQIRKKYDAGEIALCNLSSVNLLNYFYMNDEEKDRLIYNIVEMMDNTIDIAKYPVKEGMNANLMYRYLGIGVSNFTNLLGCEKITIDTQAALEFTHELFDNLSYRIISASHQLAKERGSFPNFRETKWADGVVPVHMANIDAMNLTKYQPDMDKWNALGASIKNHGIRNALTMAIAPTACQTIEGDIITSNGIKSLKTICDEFGVDWNEIESSDSIGWYEFDKPLYIQTRFGEKISHRIWYNGRQPTRTLIMDDDTEYTFTLNHKLMVKKDEKLIWKEVGDLNENDDIIEVKDIKGYEGIYKITSSGDVISCRSNIILQPELSNTGYYRVDLRKNGEHDKRTIHRLVSEAFLPNNNDKKIFINHKDGIKTENVVENLERVTPSENNLHASNVLGVKPSKLQREVASKIGKLNRVLDENTISLIKDDRLGGRTYKSIAEFYGSNISTIFRICKGESYAN